MYNEKEQAAEEKRKKYEKAREERNKEIQLRGKQKEEEIRQVQVNLQYSYLDRKSQDRGEEEEGVF